MKRQPKSWVTARNKDKWTPLHTAATNGELHKVPKEFITRNNLMLTTRDGTTVLRLACYWPESFAKLPTHLIECEDMLLADISGRSPIRYAVRHKGVLEYLRPDVLDSLLEGGHLEKGIYDEVVAERPMLPFDPFDL